MKKRYLLILGLIPVLFFSCFGRLVGASYFIEFYDENNTVIDEKSKLEEFDVSFFNNSKAKPYRDVEIRMSDPENGHYQYGLRFSIGMAYHEYELKNHWNKFNDASEYMGIKIEDKKGRYKPVTIYPLSACNNKRYGGIVVVKLEKK